MRKKGSRTSQGQFPSEHREVLLKLPSIEDCSTAAETEFWQVTLGMALFGKSPREVAEFAATGLDNPLLSRAHTNILEAIRLWARMGDTWAPWDNPDWSDYLRTIPKARDMGFNQSEVLSPLRSSFPSSGANDGWFRRNAHKLRPMHPDHPLAASFDTLIDDIHALPETTLERTRLMPPPAV